MIKRLVLATGNQGKLAEMRSLLADVNIEVLGLADLPSATAEPIEDGSTFEANARIKAISYAKQTGLPCLADDSGLIVDALDGAPGVISSHYATDGRETGLSQAERDAANNAMLLDRLAEVPFERRTARFVCTCVLTDARGEVLHVTRGAFEGRIGIPPVVPAGEGGFGYDPLFLVAPEHAVTSAELDVDEKNRRSHRGEAVRAMVSWITSSGSTASG